MDKWTETGAFLIATFGIYALIGIKEKLDEIIHLLRQKNSN